ncbi:MAG: replication-associated recombination protein A [Clostridia bacterium]|nr:replication-associated recombination protein A [Clostridia bacterium]
MRIPLADRMRPKTLEDVVGQRHILGPGKALQNMIEAGKIPNLIFYGPAGVGKTTVARIIAERSDMRLHKLNGTTASTADFREIMEETDSLMGQNGILLYLDEIQYLNKRQQQILLEYLENGRITLIASTTENPAFYVYSAVLSRSAVFEFKAIAPEEIEVAVRRGFDFLSEENEYEIVVPDKVVKYISFTCNGDVRTALNLTENAVNATVPDEEGKLILHLDTVVQLTGRSAVRYDKGGDEHYDIISAYQKSMRGSDVDAALHYLARLLEAGDLPSACRRLLVCACEDVGLAYPNIISIVKSAVDIALQVGLPEARLPLADAVIMVCQAPKSNAAYHAINAAMEDVHNGHTGAVPRQLQNKHVDGMDVEKKGHFYLYPHDFPHHWVDQQYLPDSLKDKVYYVPGNNKNEQAFAVYWDGIRKKK